MKKVLLIGNGAREHVIAETLKRSPSGASLFVVGSAVNPGIKELSTEYVIGGTSDLDFIKEFALRVKPDFCIIGPEAPIAAG